MRLKVSMTERSTRQPNRTRLHKPECTGLLIQLTLENGGRLRQRGVLHPPTLRGQNGGLNLGVISFLKIFKANRMKRILITALLLSTTPANAHGVANWIMKDPKTAYCCGPRDCGWIETESVRLEGNGYVIPEGTIIHLGPQRSYDYPGAPLLPSESIIRSQRYEIPYSFALLSNDHHYWLCLGTITWDEENRKSTRKSRCLFIPPAGT